MSDSVATSPSASTAQSAPAEASAPVSADAVEDKAPDPEAELEAHVQHALKKGKQKEAAEKAKETKAAKAQPKKAETKPVAKPAAPAEAEPDEPSKEEPPAAAIGSTAKARKLLADGDIEGAFVEAFGKKPQDFNINSKRWEEHRKAVQRDKRAVAERDAEVRRAAAELHREFGPLLEARKLYQAGKVTEAVKLAWGADVTDFNKKLIKNAHGVIPEVEELRRELQAEREAARREREERETREHEARAEQARREYVESMRNDLAESGDDQLAFLSKKRTFIGRVFEILQEHYDERTNTTLPLLEAADMARNEDEFVDVGPRHAGATAVTVQGGSNPARPGAKASTTLSQQGATEATAPPRGWHGMSLDDQVRMFANQSKANGVRA